ncbi:hypothetical protein INS49_009507 [Diaporthe citri]|uniref:uncharacterized protein n=1 Tax=Diaporthe citri TaxID=83186 RepID=UPI001C7E2944|nr:uncharacterized protein INS49_009507 [Diaporthe citri]KAG6361282.1 hypothetical protein INS49_009507 [Diaporthe citri]
MSVRVRLRCTRVALGTRMLPNNRAKSAQKVLASTIIIIGSTSIRARSWKGIVFDVDEVRPSFWNFTRDKRVSCPSVARARQ